MTTRRSVLKSLAGVSGATITPIKSVELRATDDRELPPVDWFTILPSVTAVTNVGTKFTDAEFGHDTGVLTHLEQDEIEVAYRDFTLLSSEPEETPTYVAMGAFTLVEAQENLAKVDEIRRRSLNYHFALGKDSREMTVEDENYPLPVVERHTSIPAKGVLKTYWSSTDYESVRFAVAIGGDSDRGLANSVVELAAAILRDNDQGGI